LDAVIRVLKYIKGSSGQGLLLPSENNLTLTAYCDSDWGGCQTTWNLGIAFFLVLLRSHESKENKKNVSRSPYL